MSTIFQPVTLEWNGKRHVIQPDNVLRAIAVVEECGLPLGSLHRHMASGQFPFAKISIAFGALLRFAGAAVTDEEVYDALFKGNKGAQMQRRALEALTVLNVLMIPPEHLRGPAAKPGKKKDGEKSPGSSRSSSS